MEDNLNERQPQWKMTSMKDTLKRKCLQWKKTSIEDHLNGKQAYFKKIKMNEDLNGISLTFLKLSTGIQVYVRTISKVRIYLLNINKSMENLTVNNVIVSTSLKIC
jgi:hypothetical protein